MVIYSGLTHEKWWFSIVMLVYQRVFLTKVVPNAWTSDQDVYWPWQCPFRHVFPASVADATCRREPVPSFWWSTAIISNHLHKSQRVSFTSGSQINETLKSPNLIYNQLPNIWMVHIPNLELKYRTYLISRQINCIWIYERSPHPPFISITIHSHHINPGLGDT